MDTQLAVVLILCAIYVVLSVIMDRQRRAKEANCKHDQWGFYPFMMLTEYCKRCEKLRRMDMDFRNFKAEFGDQYPGCTDKQLRQIYEDDCESSNWDRINAHVWM